jgi:hypothetical protein
MESLKLALEDMEDKQKHIDVRDKDVIRLGEAIVEKDKELRLMRESVTLHLDESTALHSIIKELKAESKAYRDMYRDVKDAIWRDDDLGDHSETVDRALDIQTALAEAEDKAEVSEYWRLKYRRLVDLMREIVKFIGMNLHGYGNFCSSTLNSVLKEHRANEVKYSKRQTKRR